MSVPVPKAAIDAAEKEWYARVSRGQYDPPRVHIEALLEVAMPFLEVVPSQIVADSPKEELP